MWLSPARGCGKNCPSRRACRGPVLAARTNADFVTTDVHRVARSHVLFREVNERVRTLAHSGPLPGGEYVEFVCECGRQECHEPIRLTLNEYCAVRSEPAHFAVLPDHEEDKVEAVIHGNDRYRVVRRAERATTAARSRH